MTKNQNNQEWKSWIKALVIAVIITFLVRTFLFIPIAVEGPSMQPNLEDRDYVVINKLNYRISEPKRFDVVVFHASVDKDYIKRVIGLPGETVEYVDDVLYINGSPIEETHLVEELARLEEGERYTRDFSLEDIPGGHEVIPENHVLLLGDNRPNSTDSRNLGLIPYDELVGSASVIYWPINRIGIVK
ncbi:signal peptidase I [Natronobacillus azotifigens]|uniref:Signal peptidase I n=1 Tax=Natronobacillus azotifigens TaxID=472978 RepID=A0A9J6RCI9_9BACI|nr:signal peptidase I [Natronobacillus azotifigens]MCZ0703408.1 signal peptidase I [Natronobacillus azotifigens]